jgi:hypothetical protein
MGDYEFLTADDLREYGMIAAGQFQGDVNNPRVRKLVHWGFVTFHPDHPSTPVALDPKQAARRKFAEELAQAEARVARLKTLPDLSDQLSELYTAPKLRAGTPSAYLDDPAVVNARLQDVVGSARRQILSAQPGGPRSAELLALAVQRDADALDRGVEIRTIYRDTVRDHPVTAEYARIMSGREDGGRAQYRTLVGKFERMIIVDGEQAFISDHIVAGGPAHAAWHVTDAAVVAVLAGVFDSEWMRAKPWSGELRARRGDARDTIGASGRAAALQGVRTTRRQREIMRNLCAGVAQTTIARRIGVSKRKLDQEIAALKALWGVATLSELVYQWALSPDHEVSEGEKANDTAATEVGQDAVDTAA